MNTSLRKRHIDAINGNKSVHSGVVGLRCSARPIAVLWRIWSVCISSFQSQTIRSFPHIGNEVLKNLPALANTNPSAAVIFPRLYIRVGAAPFHCRPNDVLRCIRASVFRSLRLGELTSVTSATYYKSASQCIQRGDMSVSAVTYAQPIAVLRVSPLTFLSHKSSKSITRNVVRCAHGF